MLIFVAWITMGINLWFAPQISEHCPYNSPGRLIIMFLWFIRPGVASFFTPKLGIVHEWITSNDEMSIRIWVFMGNTNLLSTSNNRNSLFSSSNDGFIYESNSIFLKSEYSYDQYHWWPIVLIVNKGLFVSSIKYRIFNDGIAIKINIIAGRTVQINSMDCSSISIRFVNFLNDNIVIMYPTQIVIATIIIIVWSWNIINCSIIGEFASCKLILDHVEIFNKIILFLNEF